VSENKKGPKMFMLLPLNSRALKKMAFGYNVFCALRIREAAEDNVKIV